MVAAAYSVDWEYKSTVGSEQHAEGKDSLSQAPYHYSFEDVNG